MKRPSRRSNSKSLKAKKDKVREQVASNSSRGSRKKKNFATKHASNIAHKRKVKKTNKAKAKAEYLATLPKSRIKRFFYRLHPKRVFKYWFSKQGLIMAMKLTGIGFAVLVVFILSLFAYFRKDLPDPRDISARRLNQSTKFYDKTGEQLLFEVYGDENRTVVEFDQISDAAKNATVAVEDKDFYFHRGVSFSGIGRAAWSNLISGDATGQGGSTITQQFIKNSLLTVDQTYTRKVQEIILAIELERLYSKDEILSFYLNEIPYGPQEYGIQAAAQSFFRKDASDLGIAEAAMLAALPQAPTYFSPYGENTGELLARKDVIIDLMASQGYITPEQSERAKNVKILKKVTPLDDRSLYNGVIAPHFVIEVQQQLEELFGPSLVQSGGLKVITSLDYELQEIANKAVKQNMATVVNPLSGGGSGDNAAFVATDVETGQVLALVGSRDFNYKGYGSFNAALADRQPGSSFKPFDYAQLFYSERWGPDSFIYDTPTTWGDYQPKNFDFGYKGQMTVRRALGESRNIPAVKAADIAGIDNVANLAIAMGNESLSDDPSFDLSYSLGAGEVKLAEHAHAYATFARGGKYVPQSFIVSVENTDGEVLLEWEQPEGEQVLDEQVAYLATNMLLDDAARSGTFGLGNPRLVVPGIRHTVKTGTTDSSVDGWMMGYTKHMSFGVWVGNHDNKPMNSVTSWQTGPIFTQFIREAYEKKSDLDKQAQIFDSVPEGIKRIALDKNTGYAASDSTKSTYTGLFPSWHVPEKQSEINKFTIDTVSGFAATECTPERALEESSGGGKWPEVLPDDYRFPLWSRTTGYKNSGSAPSKKDNVHKCSDALPEADLTVTQINDETYRFSSNATAGTHPLGTLNFVVDGQIVSSNNLSSSGGYTEYVHTFGGDGDYDVWVEIIDDVLYDNQTPKQVVGVSGAGSSPLQFTSHSDGGTYNPLMDFDWNSYPGATSYRFCYEEICLNTGNNSDTDTNLDSYSGQSVTIYIRAYHGSKQIRESDPITIDLN